jgi:hypothetical protein
MSAPQIQSGEGRPGLSGGTALAGGCLFLFALPFAGFGVFAAVQAFRELNQGRLTETLFLGLFALIFGGVGFGLMIGGVYGRRKLRQEQARQQSSPDEPWRWRGDWASGRVVATNRQTMAGAWVFALFWNGVSSFVWFALPGELAKGNRLALVGLLFPLVGLGILIWAIRATWRWRRFGQSTLELAAIPAPLGGQLCGLITSQHPLQQAQSVRLRLTCIRRESNGKSTTDRLLWEDEKRLDADAVRSTGGVPVFFNIPADGEPASPATSLPRVVWRLEARASLPGVDYAAQFEVPIFRVALDGAGAQPAEDPTARWQKNAGQYQPDPASPIRVQTTARGETELVFPAARNPGMGLGLLAIAAIWSGFLWLLIVKHAPLIFPIVWTLFDVLLLLALINVWFGYSRVVAGRDGLEVRRRWLFVGRTRSFAAAEVREVKTAIGMTSGNRALYDIKIVTSSGKSFTAASMIPDRRQADWLAQQVQGALGLRRETPELQNP